MTRKRFRITEGDNFIWKLLTEQEAKDCMEHELFSLYALHDDNTESFICDEEELQEAINDGLDVGIEVGFLQDIIKY